MNTIKKYRMPDNLPPLAAATLDLVLRQHLAVFEDVYEWIFAPAGRCESACYKSLAKLTDQRLLKKFEYDGTAAYWRAGPQACGQWGVPCTRTQEIQDNDRLAYHIAANAFLRDIGKQRLLPGELGDLFPGLLSVPRMQRWAYFRDDDAEREPRLATIRVEIRSSATSIVARIDNHLKKAREVPAFTKLQDQGRFRIVVIVPSRLKAKRVSEALPQRLPITVSYYPALGRFF